MLRLFFLLIGLLVALASCRRNHMSLISPQIGTAIYYIHFAEQSDDAIFEGDTIYIPVSQETYLGGLHLKLDSLIVSDYAKVDKKVGDMLDYSKPVRFRLVAENGLRRTYTVIAMYSRSKGNSITNFILEGQVGPAKIIPAQNPQDDDTISVNIKRIFFLTGLDLRLKKAIRSKGSLIVPAEGTVSVYRSPVRYRVTSGEGMHHYYVVRVNEMPEEEPQIENSDFEKWYHQSVYSVAYLHTREYDNLGINSGDLKRWASYNDGMAQANYEFSLSKGEGFRGLDDRNKSGTAAVLTTQNLRSVTAGLGSRGIVPGVIFTGAIMNVFNGNVQDGWNIFTKWAKNLGANILNTFQGRPHVAGETAPNSNPTPEDFRQNSIYGILFSGHPKSVRFDYKYFPKGSDKMDAFLLLENRSLDGQTVKRLGVAWLRSGNKQESWKTADLPIFYARDNKEPRGYFPYQNEKIPDEAKVLDYQLPNQPKPIWGDARKDEITHIVIVFTSSFNSITKSKIGDPGSQLWVDNLHLNY